MDKEEMEIRFITFVSMLGTAAMQHMGKLADPMTGKVHRDLPSAKATIDMLVMLQAKTKNNLTKNEENTFDQLLSNLQLNYVEESGKPDSADEEISEAASKKEEGSAKKQEQGEKQDDGVEDLFRKEDS